MARPGPFNFTGYSGLFLAKDDSKDEFFVDVCYSMRWDEVKRMMLDKPSLIWTARCYIGNGPVHFIAAYGNVEILELMVSLIYRQPQELQKQILFDAFERSNKNGVTPLHNAASNGDVRNLKFLVEHCPSGPSVLEIKNRNGWAPIHYAIRYKKIDAMKYILQNAPSGAKILEEKDKNDRTMAHFAVEYGDIESLEFILRNSPSGIEMLSVKDGRGETPLEVRKSFEQYFTSRKIREIGLENETERFNIFFDADSLISIVFGVIRQDIEVQVYRLHKNTF